MATDDSKPTNAEEWTEYPIPPEVINRRETWRDWLPPDATPIPDVVTREELLEMLFQRHGISLPERTLRSWEASGALPYPEARRHRGAPRALYPRGYEAVLAEVVKLRVVPIPHRISLRDLQAHVRPIFETYARTWRPAPQLSSYGDMPSELATAVMEFVTDMENATAARRAEVRVFDGNGKEIERRGIELSWEELAKKSLPNRLDIDR